VPWCADCDRFLSPSTVQADGSCPSCGGAVDVGRPQRGATAQRRVPWYFKLLGIMLALYLGYRAYQGIDWLAGRL
jgi:hypothetical protein